MKLQLQQTGFHRISNVVIPESFYNRMKTGDQLDKLFGEGILPGMSMTMSGAAGLGKTTLLLQLLEGLAAVGYNVGYCSGEEAVEQLAFTSARLGIQRVNVASISDVDVIKTHMEAFDILVIDSYQSLTSENDLNSKKLEQYIITQLIGNAAASACTLIFVMHQTVMGTLKGGTAIPHAVDCNIKMYRDKDAPSEERVIEFSKNRFGRTGSFLATMTEHGITVSDDEPIATMTVSKKNDLHERIMAMDNPPQITKQRVAAELDITEQQAYCALYQLEKLGRIVKFGTGKQVVYKHAVVMEVETA